jgi:hypothetical protein
MLTIAVAEDKEAEKAKKRDEKIAAEHDKTAAKEEKQRAKTAEKEEKARQQDTSRVHDVAVAQASRKSVERQDELARKSTSDDAHDAHDIHDTHDTHQEIKDASQPRKSTDKKSPFKKLFSKSDREPGKISMFDHKNKTSKIDSKAQEEKEKDKAKGRASGKDVPLPPDGYALATGKFDEEPSSSITDRPSTPADKGKQREVGSGKSSVELTPTGATMAGDGPSTIAAPDREPEVETATEGINTHAATTVVDNRTDRQATTTTTDDTEPSNPKKKRFSTLLGKLKRNKDNKKEKDTSDSASFTGGAKLHKERHSTATETTTSSPAAGAAPTTAAGVSTAGAASGIHAAARSRSPSLVSSLSSSDYENTEEQRGRSQTRLDRVAADVVAIEESSSDEDGEEFEEAKDRFEGGALEPPRELLSKKHAESPVRDSRFVENI